MIMKTKQNKKKNINGEILESIGTREFDVSQFGLILVFTRFNTFNRGTTNKLINK